MFNINEHFYKCKGNNVFRDNKLLISHIVYQCSRCENVSKTIAESDLHYFNEHQRSRKSKKWRQTEDIKSKTKNKVNVSQCKSSKENESLPPKPLTVEDNQLVAKSFPVERVVRTNIDIESGFKEFNEINCVKSLKTYSRKQVPNNGNTEDNNQNDSELNANGSDPVVMAGLHECDICGQIYNEYNLRIHKKIHTNPQICSFCGQVFGSETQLYNHLKTHEPKQSTPRVKCDYCSSEFADVSNMREHRSIHTNPQICDYPNCGKKFSTLKRLKDHKRIHNKCYKFKCLLCNKLFPYLHTLRQHKKLHTNPFICTFYGCGRRFISQSQLSVHLTTHSNDKPYVCDIPGCSVRFKHKSYINSHKKSVHQKLRPYKCVYPDCGKAFGSRSDLNTHNNTCHQKRSDFICDWPECDKGFATSHLLYRHMELHTGEKPYVCDIGECDKNFSTLQLLNVHKKIHKPKTPVECEFCDIKLNNRLSLSRHLKAIHNIKHEYIRKLTKTQE